MNKIEMLYKVNEKLNRRMDRYAAFRKEKAPKIITNAELELVDEALVEAGLDKEERIKFLHMMITDNY